MHRVILGISPAEPGYRSVRIAPRPGGGLTWARGSLQTRHGLVAVSWQAAEDNRLDVTVTLPDGITAELELPGSPPVQVTGGEHTLSGRTEVPTPANVAG